MNDPVLCNVVSLDVITTERDRQNWKMERGREREGERERERERGGEKETERESERVRESKNMLPR